MRKIYKYLLLALLIVLQSTLFRFIDIFGVKPDAVFMVVLSFSLLNGPWEAVYLSLFAGIIQDILFNNALGVTTFSLLIVSYLTGLLSKSVFKESSFVACVFVFLGTLLYNLITMFSMVLMKYQFNFLLDFVNIAMIQALYNSIITVFVYRYLVSFNIYVTKNKVKFFKKSKF
ncbi:rod shape-determining protein MreD [Thermoanaerobacter sp. CM-CNRG TB177]|jgi:rod shape-determining protein MreD|uniref:rod shape-determining protein MreD n=1 Tax=Thermoanaerobacter sp. CM-CNRG TB177 TaxID=2800659 RepID=UPI001BDE7EA8|nr:rod shape-determining protein MreD [Thermoanaerobacter sp. CM-CNRG TB177]MBT1280391.1 rod shape-determining protein MreD [Thermoanaerobacter sp. CM-CNRG TB177]MDK2814597.1 rod shape-determining protein MreD [Thermoanaerobacter sp.]